MLCLPEDMAINKVLFFDFIFIFSFFPRKQDSHFLELYKIYTVRGGGDVWPCQGGGVDSKQAQPVRTPPCRGLPPIVPPPRHPVAPTSAWQGQELGTEQHQRGGTAGGARGCSTDTPQVGGKGTSW